MFIKLTLCFSFFASFFPFYFRVRNNFPRRLSSWQMIIFSVQRYRRRSVENISSDVSKISSEIRSKYIPKLWRNLFSSVGSDLWFLDLLLSKFNLEFFVGVKSVTCGIKEINFWLKKLLKVAFSTTFSCSPHVWRINVTVEHIYELFKCMSWGLANLFEQILLKS